MGLWKDLISEGEINGTTRPYYHHDHHHHHYHQTESFRLSHKRIMEQTTPSTLQPSTHPTFPPPDPTLSCLRLSQHPTHTHLNIPQTLYSQHFLLAITSMIQLFSQITGFFSSPYPTPAPSLTPHLDYEIRTQFPQRAIRMHL